MEAFASDAEKFADADPRMKLLRGFIDADKASVLLLTDEDGKKDIKKDAAEALSLCTMAFSYGEYWKFYSIRSKALDHAISLNPAYYDNYLDRARLLYNMDKINDSLQDLNSAEKLSPVNSAVKEWEAIKKLL